MKPLCGGIIVTASMMQAHDFYTSIATSPIRATIINIINNGKDYDQSMDALEDTYINKFYQTYSS